MSVREEVIRLIEQVPENDLGVLKRMLRGLILFPEATEDARCASLDSANMDDQPATEEDPAAIASAKEELSR